MGSRDSVVGKDLETKGVSGEKASNVEQRVCHGARAVLSGQARERVRVSPQGPFARGEYAYTGRPGHSCGGQGVCAGGMGVGSGQLLAHAGSGSPRGRMTVMYNWAGRALCHVTGLRCERDKVQATLQYPSHHPGAGLHLPGGRATLSDSHRGPSWVSSGPE